MTIGIIIKGWLINKENILFKEDREYGACIYKKNGAEIYTFGMLVAGPPVGITGELPIWDATKAEATSYIKKGYTQVSLIHTHGTKTTTGYTNFSDRNVITGKVGDPYSAYSETINTIYLFNVNRQLSKLTITKAQYDAYDDAVKATGILDTKRPIITNGLTMQYVGEKYITNLGTIPK